LHGESERIIAEPDLLDDVVGRAPRFHFATIAEAIDRLMMGAVHFCKPMRGGAIVTQWLDIVIALLRKVVTFDVELERATERDVKNLEAFANREDRNPARDRGLKCVKFPTVAFWIDIFVQHRGIGNVLSKEFRGNVGTSG